MTVPITIISIHKTSEVSFLMSASFCPAMYQIPSSIAFHVPAPRAV